MAEYQWLYWWAIGMAAGFGFGYVVATRAARTRIARLHRSYDKLIGLARLTSSPASAVMRQALQTIAGGLTWHAQYRQVARDALARAAAEGK